ncbi:phage head closure protein [Agrobacterium rosae]|uniref:Head-tail adaptor protein n=1 Tax=Agrobacterium rosae TaxID=1972867 RepID=A0AAE5VPR2_9HYPH|nr:phage head closure protein [Agrobacterium rosae]KAA3514404.1 head-tail adaptor protein [Agrobacterium rosae]KAA3523070.1 head-tail adaptor protein [Agrobacterium rosae]MCM2436349.1 phage head closure protein [Agrobacterium rosae]MDX8329824.1 phage head closure protein [Agrobacterium rosae]MQB47786.1 head-tail adaptor protein [Agrobacterium rosae]
MNLTFLDPGQLTARLELEAPEELPDGQGGVTAGWRLLRSLWAAIEPVSQGAYERASADGVAVTHRIWAGFRSDIEAGMRFRKGARVFAVKSVIDPDETGRFIVCRCEEESR